MKHRDWTDWTSIGFEVAKPSGSLEPCNGTSNSSFVWNCKEKSEICETAMSVSTPWKLVFNNKNRDVTKQGGCDGMIVEINWGTVSFLEYTGEDSWKLKPLPKGCRIMSDVVWYWIITKKTVHLEKCSKPKTIQNHPQPFSKTSRTLKKKVKPITGPKMSKFLRSQKNIMRLRRGDTTGCRGRRGRVRQVRLQRHLQGLPAQSVWKSWSIQKKWPVWQDGAPSR